MPRKATRLASPTIRIFMGRNPPTVPLFSSMYSKCSRLYSTSKGVLGILVCILPRPIPSPMTCAGSSQCHTAFRCSQALSLSSSCPVSWLLPDPSSFAFPVLSRFLALTDLPVLCYLRWWWCGLRRAARGPGRGVEVEEGG